MAVSATEFESLLSQASDAVASNQFAAARRLVVRARIVLAGLPDYNIGDRGARYRSDLDNIDKSITDLRAEYEADEGVEVGEVFALVDARV